MVEPFVFYLINEFKIPRLGAIAIVGVCVYCLGTLCALSNITEFKDALTFFGKGFFDVLDYLSSNIMLPLGGIVIAVFVGYAMKRVSLEELFLPYMGRAVFEIWYFLLRFVAPICILAIMIRQILGS